VREREERLRGFNRMISHELKNDLGAIAGAHALLGESWLDPEKRARFLDMIGENLERVNVVLDNLISLSRLDTRPQQHRHVRLPQAAAEAVRQLRTMAQRRGVAVRLAPDLPPVEVNAAAIELCLTNYLSNAIKYSDAAKEDRWVEISAAVRGDADQGGPFLALEVMDNGLGVPEPEQPRLFERFFRTHDATVSAIEGTGLGLSIVKETVESLGGTVWAAPRPGSGSIFGLSLPCRRESEAEVAPRAARALD
jgi:signal transduction histidine kinase